MLFVAEEKNSWNKDCLVCERPTDHYVTFQVHGIISLRLTADWMEPSLSDTLLSKYVQ